MADPSASPGLDWGGIVSDRLVLRSLRGATDYLADELRQVSATTTARVEVVRRRPDRLDVELTGPLAALRPLHFFSEAAVDLGEPSETEERLRISLTEGALSALPGPVRFRVGDLGDERWELRDRLVQTWGWDNAPRGWQVNLDLVEGHLLATVGDLHLTRRHGRLERLPASTTPVLAAALVRLAKIPPGAVVVDPFCGAGTNLLLAHAMTGPELLVGLDHRPDSLAPARANATRREAPLRLVRADATRLPLSSGCADRVIGNLPFGKRVGSHGANQELYPRFCRELDRVLTGDGRAVLLTEDKRLLVDSIQRTRGLRVIKEATFETGGAHPTAYVVVRSRGQARRRHG
ncbi:MAG TPA: methyltransferase domain-containing protein [Nocardioides sp.]|uniref:TRM11 family SAM-dependent methyltransferase n=1 Tax=Nocardioides sp. TaxID=35761 RepID=UPI002E32C306|nr:methyltransferase domain-containing protein [Nocardioides sp.]HEX3930307.1 methyltransferase domain-containing protein [Nocardioides sp.]